MGGSDLSKKIDYVSQKGILEFQHAETTKTITVDINKNAQVSDCNPYDWCTHLYSNLIYRQSPV